MFTAPRGGPPKAKDPGRRLFNHAAEPIGIPDLVAHDLRDTAASLAILRERPSRPSNGYLVMLQPRSPWTSTEASSTKTSKPGRQARQALIGKCKPIQSASLIMVRSVVQIHAGPLPDPQQAGARALSLLLLQIG